MESRFFREMPRWPIDTWKDTIASDKKTKTYVIPVSFITLLRVTIISKGSDRCWGVSVWRRWNLVLSAEVWSAQGDRGAPCERIQLCDQKIRLLPQAPRASVTTESCDSQTFISRAMQESKVGRQDVISLYNWMLLFSLQQGSLLHTMPWGAGAEWEGEPQSSLRPT